MPPSCADIGQLLAYFSWAMETYYNLLGAIITYFAWGFNLGVLSCIVIVLGFMWLHPNSTFKDADEETGHSVAGVSNERVSAVLP